MSLTIEPRLLDNAIILAPLFRCHILLKNNATIPWVLVVPEAPREMQDLHDLDEAQYQETTQVIRVVSHFVDAHFQPEKLNVACIGNQVRQMHIHIVARHPDDPAWPGVVWGAHYPKKPYAEAAIATIRNAFRAFIENDKAQL